MNNTIRRRDYFVAKNESINSLLISLAFLFNSICLLANILFPNISNFGKSFVVVLLSASLMVCIASPMKLNTSLILINGASLIAMVLSYAFYNAHSDIKNLLMNYLAWGIGITAVMMQKYNIRRVLDITFWISVFIIILDLVNMSHENYEAMVWTYAIFPCIAASLIHFSYCRFSGRRMMLAYVPGAISLVKFVSYANRGGLISLLALLFLIFISPSKRGKRLQKHYFLAVLLLILSVLLIVNLGDIVDSLYNYLADRNVEIKALSKMKRLYDSNNFTNNREELYEYAWNGFLSSPVWGNGIGAFSVNHGGWAHNFILQLLYEGGFLMAFIILAPLIQNCAFLLKNDEVSVDEYSFFILLFSTSVPRLFFSTELWNTQAFWMLFAFAMIIKNKYSLKR